MDKHLPFPHFGNQCCQSLPARPAATPNCDGDALHTRLSLPQVPQRLQLGHGGCVAVGHCVCAGCGANMV